MARANPDEYCMLCEQAPCACKKIKTPAPKTKRPEKKQESAPDEKPRISAVQAMREASLRPPTPEPSRPRAQFKARDGEQDMIDAVLTVHALLGARPSDLADLAEMRAMIAQGPSAKVRAYLWNRGDLLGDVGTPWSGKEQGEETG